MTGPDLSDEPVIGEPSEAPELPDELAPPPGLNVLERHLWFSDRLRERGIDASEYPAEAWPFLLRGLEPPRQAPLVTGDPGPVDPGGAGRALDEVTALAGIDELAQRRGARARGLDDIGNGERFAEQHADAVRFVPAFGTWLVYDGKRLREDDVLAVARKAKATVRSIAAEAAREPDGDRRKALLAHALRSAGEPRLRALLTNAASDERIVLRAADLDRDPWILNTWNGGVDLRTGELRPHDIADNLTMLAGAAYDPAATATVWDAHLRRCLVTDELIAFMQRLAGYSAIGVTRDHILAIMFGSGGNGKSVYRDAIAGALGDYAYQSSGDLLMQTGRGPGQATPELAELRGRRLVTVAETPEDGKLASERVKSITGGEPINARRLYGHPFTFEPSHTIWVLTNHKPRVPDDSDAIWRRVLPIPFTVTIPPAEWDRDIDAKLAHERPGILRWIVDGARAYLRDGLNPPEAVTAAATSYRQSEDLFGAFLDENTVTEDGTSISAAAALAAYTGWAKESGAPTLSANAVAEKLVARGYERKRVKTGTRYLGLHLRTEGTLDA